MFRFPGLSRTLLLVAAVRVAAASLFLSAQPPNATPGEPAAPKARKLFTEAVEWQQRGQQSKAIEAYREAGKQDGGRCFECTHRAFMMAMDAGDFKVARAAVDEGMAGAQSDADRAKMHFWLGTAWQNEGVRENEDKYFAESCGEFKTALALNPALTPTYYSYGVSLAYLHQDDEARAQFSAFLKLDKELPILHPRAQRFVEHADLARARMAPDFSITTPDGQHVSLDSLAGKVVLIDFWATWCGPCVEALPHLRNIVQEFRGQPFVAISVSRDQDDAVWKKFVTAHKMTWLQYRDDGSANSLAGQFGVKQVPATFSINAEGILEDQNLVGDERIDDKLKKLIAQAVEMQNHSPSAAPSSHP